MTANDSRERLAQWVTTMLSWLGLNSSGVPVQSSDAQKQYNFRVQDGDDQVLP